MKKKLNGLILIIIVIIAVIICGVFLYKQYHPSTTSTISSSAVLSTTKTGRTIGSSFYSPINHNHPLNGWFALPL